MTTTSPIRELSAAEITKTALMLLSLRKIEAWRQTNTVVRRRKGTCKEGVSDILGIEKASGKLVAAEVKKIGDRLSDEQKEFLEMVRASGGIALIACQIINQVYLVPYEEYIKKKP